MASVILSRRELFRNRFDGKVGGGQGHTQPAPVFILAQQHHGGPSAPASCGEKFRLADEQLAGADDGFFVDRRRDQRVELAGRQRSAPSRNAASAALAASGEPAADPPASAGAMD